MQQRFNAAGNHLRPHRWNWSMIIRPLDRQLAQQAEHTMKPMRVFNLRYFWLDGLFSAISDNFHLGFIPLFALSLGAGTGQVGWLTAVANLLGALAFFPGAKLTERSGRRKRLVIWSGGGLARFAFLGLAMLPFITQNTTLAIWLIVGLSGLQAFMGSLANPAWTALVADLVPESVRGRYFGSRNMAMGVAALLVAPLAGILINQGNALSNDFPYLGYQSVFLLAFIFGMVATFSFSRIQDQKPAAITIEKHKRGDLRRVLRQHPTFVGLVISAFIWNLALFVAAPFFNVYLVQEFDTSTTIIGMLAAVSSLTALIGQRVFGHLLDKKSALWVQMICGFIIPVLPLAWVYITASWQVAIINALGGFIWGGYNLSNFNLLLKLAPNEQQPRAVALYQTAVFSSAFIGPIIGGYLADTVSFQFIFGISAFGRLLGMVVFAGLAVKLPVLKLRTFIHKI
jgi:MFS family permease